MITDERIEKKETRRYCMDCRFWGKEWIRDLERQCWNAQNQRTGMIYSTAMMATCDYFEPLAIPPLPEKKYVSPYGPEIEGLNSKWVYIDGTPYPGGK